MDETDYGLIDVCEDCGDDTPILNHHDGKNYLTWTGKHLYCLCCLEKNMAEPSERSEVS